MDEYSQADVDMYYDDGGGYASRGGWMEEEEEEEKVDSFGIRRHVGKGKEEEEEEEEEYRFGKRKAEMPPPSDIVGGKDDGLLRNLRLTSVNGSVAPLQKRIRSEFVVPFRVQLSADILLQNAGKSRLSNITCSELQRIVDCDDEFTIVDPYVVLCDTIPAGAFKVYMKEAVPVSRLLLLRALKCTYGVGTKLRSYSGDVTVRPFKDTRTTHVQGFGCDRAIEDALETAGLDEPEVMAHVRAYMIKVGAQPSYVACDCEFLDAHLKEVKNIINGTSSHLME